MKDKFGFKNRIYRSSLQIYFHLRFIASDLDKALYTAEPPRLLRTKTFGKNRFRQSFRMARRGKEGDLLLFEWFENKQKG